MMLWQLGFAVEGWNRVQAGDKDKPPPMTAERFNQLMEARGHA